MADARDAFTERLARQSQTFHEAVAEYKRRYGRDPPRGFDDWWQFANENEFKLIDEFDAIDEDLAPFWKLLRRGSASEDAAHLPAVDLVRIQDGNVSEVRVQKVYEDIEPDHPSTSLVAILEKFQHKLPNMHFAINLKAEGRVLPYWESMQERTEDMDSPICFGSFACMATGGVQDRLGDFTPDRTAWEGFQRTCPRDSPAWKYANSHLDPIVPDQNEFFGQLASSNDSFAFVKTVDDNYDYCQKPREHYTQGHFFTDVQAVSVLYPIFSPARARGFFDIRIPSHYYYTGGEKYTYAWDQEHGIVKETDDLEVPWDEKGDRIFWRGATTGGGSKPPGYTPFYQRHRFLRMTHGNASANLSIVHVSPSQPDEFISTTVPAKKVNSDIMDVAFVSIVGSYPGGEQELRRLHRFADPVPLGKHWSYKYLVDLDGMSYSARFLAFLASGSAVIKSTVYKEFFSDWIQPWLHYIPLSSSYAEIYNIHAYFSGPSTSTMDAANMAVKVQAEWEAIKNERDAQLRQVAEAGKEWKHTFGRPVDMEVYVYRLMLEYARLWMDDRDAMKFVL
ncbi:glycosyltransferase family 90 protein [Chiua virens]|nr:glycosyltransferase family 90 protein [Chiua virens]